MNIILNRNISQHIQKKQKNTHKPEQQGKTKQHYLLIYKADHPRMGIFS